MRKNKLTIESFLKQKRFVQAGDFYPVLINSAALTGFEMKRYLGFGYSGFLFRYHHDHGEMNYLISDFERIWQIIYGKIKRNPNYLRNVKIKYEKMYFKFKKLFFLLDESDLPSLSDTDLLRLLKRAIKAQRWSVGLGHVLETLSQGADAALRSSLEGRYKFHSDFNRDYALLTAPVRISFFTKEQNELGAISRLPIRRRETALLKHFLKYRWLKNSYLGDAHLTVEYFRRRMKHTRTSDFEKPNKGKLFSRYNLTPDEKRLIRIIEFAFAWQDERKRNIAIANGYLGRSMEELERRTRMKNPFIYYIDGSEILKARSITEIKQKFSQKVLSNLRSGSFYLLTPTGTQIVSGRLYQKFLKSFYYQKHNQNKNKIVGSVANPGKIAGRVSVVRSLRVRSIPKGNVLVISMTRPEHMHLIGSAAAIVTDEGGITSHAAIVSRELGIPCIIGTKIATEVLKDGDLVEVDANHGWVRKINNKS